MKTYNQLMLDESAATTINSDAYQLQNIYGYAVQASYTVESPAAAVLASATDIDHTTETFTKTNHGFQTGLKVALTTSSALPTGLSATDYYIIRVDANTFKIATSAANATAGTVQTFSSNGTGNQTFTPAALAGGNIKLQATNDNALDPRVTPVWTDLSNTQAVSATGAVLWNVADAFYSFVRVQATMTAGQVDFYVRLNAKGV
jgi:hypothetical protein